MKIFSYFIILFLLVLSCRNDDEGPEKSEQGIPVITFVSDDPLEVDSVTAVIKATVQCYNKLSAVILCRVDGDNVVQVMQTNSFSDSTLYEMETEIEVNSRTTGVTIKATDIQGNGEDKTLEISAGIADAFPGAEGFGRYATGGRGGTVYEVTNLNDSGEGSLRNAIGKSGARIIVFRVSGTIELQSYLKITEGNITIAGQTAPGDGICIRNYPLMINSGNVIIRFIRSRLGDEKDVEDDAMGGRFHKNIIIDHCSMSWSVDECVSVYSNENTTVQWCLISESLKNSVHEKGAHGYGGIWGGNKASFHHNLLAHHGSRTPRFGPGTTTQLTEYTDMRNNVIYNWSGNGCYGAEAMHVNIVNNFYKPGAATPSGSKRGRIISIDKKTDLAEDDDFYPINNVWGQFYISGNVVDASTSTSSGDIAACNNATGDNWDYGVYNQFNSKYTVTDAVKSAMKQSVPFDFGDIETYDAETAYSQVLDYAGCSLVRDKVDLRIIEETRNGTYTYTGSISGEPGIIDTPSDAGGYPNLESITPPDDSDSDGMPDSWETKNGLNPADGSDGVKKTLDAKYTNLEVYLNSLVEDLFPQ